MAAGAGRQSAGNRGRPESPPSSRDSGLRPSRSPELAQPPNSGGRGRAARGGGRRRRLGSAVGAGVFLRLPLRAFGGLVGRVLVGAAVAEAVAVTAREGLPGVLLGLPLGAFGGLVGRVLVRLEGVAVRCGRSRR